MEGAPIEKQLAVGARPLGEQGQQPETDVPMSVETNNFVCSHLCIGGTTLQFQGVLFRTGVLKEDDGETKWNKLPT